MADANTTEPELPELPDPAFAPPEASASVAPPEPDESEDVAEPEPPPVENREAMLARENAQLRDILTNYQAQQQQFYRQPSSQEPQDPYAPFLRGIDPAQQPAWRESLKVLNPVVQHMIQQATAPLQDELRVTRTYAESAALAQERNPQTGDVLFPEYPQYAAQCEAARYQEYQRTGIWHPLRLVYLVMKGSGAVPTPQQTAKQERTRTRRAQAARVPAATTAEPQQGARMPAPARRTVEQTMAMSDDQMKDLATKNGIDWPGQPTRKRVA